jgi:bifunctional DNA-binding transcriptional regulator/antitoxin component of YhaV-PrlF toxin-antitoxin module
MKYGKLLVEVGVMLTKRTFKNQITIPKQIIERFGNVEYFDVSARNNEIILRPVEIKEKGQYLSQAREKIKALGLKEDDITEAIRWARRG